MKKKILILMLLLVTNLAPVISRPVMLRARSTFQRGCMRMPSATHISADYDSGVITLSISAYSGNVQAYVYDLNGSVVAYDCSSISGSGTFDIDVNNLEEGNYSLCIVLGSVTYYGEFQVY